MALNEDRAQILAKYGPYVRSLANSVRKHFTVRLDMEELTAFGTVGLLEAAERFDARQGVSFLTFAHYRIKGSIFDGLRKMGILKGPDQRAAYLSERSSAYLSAASACDSVSRARSFADDVQTVETAVTSLAALFATGLNGVDHLRLRDETADPEERLSLAQLKQRVKAVVEKLPENERKLLIAYYYENKTLEEAGQIIGQSKSWSSRLHARAIERIKDLLSAEMDIPSRRPEQRKPTGGSRDPPPQQSPPTRTR